MGQQLEDQSLDIPPPASLAGCKYDPLHYFMVGDEAFPLKENMKLNESERGIQLPPFTVQGGGSLKTHSVY